MLDFVYLVALLPLLGFVTILLFGRKLGEPLAGWVATAAVGGSFVSAVITWIGLIDVEGEERREVTKKVFEWVPAGDFSVDVAFLVDPLSVAMILFVTGIGTLIHLYSIGYMHGDPNFSKFFLYLNLFIFSMLMLVLGDNLLLTFLGWEGVGACSYLLISFWFTEDANATAGKKAFVTNRVGDWGFMVATFLAFATVGSIDYLTLNGTAGQMSESVATGITLLVFVGAMGKSAQFPLYLWLPDAMAGPTPVSALIHAATMVTSGVYLLTRINNVLHEAAPWSTDLIAWFGAGTALFAATIAVAQNDIKKVLAYSTVSQLGYMILAVGTGAYVAAIFHMITHAFFKALLFLGSGSVIHGMADEQDMRRYGALRKLMPITAVTFIIGWLAIAGVPPFAGFWSKDEILLSAYDLGGVNGIALWVVGLVTAMLTAFYMSRQVFMTFFGRYRFADPDESEIDEAWANFIATHEADVTKAEEALGKATEGIEKATKTLDGAAKKEASAQEKLDGAEPDKVEKLTKTLNSATQKREKAEAGLAEATTKVDEANVSIAAAKSTVAEVTARAQSRPIASGDEVPEPGEVAEFLPPTVAARAEHHPHESPWTMTVPLVLLSGLAIVGGGLNLPFTKDLHFLEHWLEPSLYHEHVVNASGATKWVLAFVAIAVGAIGIGLAFATYMQRRVDSKLFERSILEQGWGYDKAVTAFMGGPGRVFFDAVAWFDKNIIDGVVNGTAQTVRSGGGLVRRVQTGYVRTYAVGIAIGSIALMAWFLLRTY